MKQAGGQWINQRKELLVSLLILEDLFCRLCGCLSCNFKTFLPKFKHIFVSPSFQMRVAEFPLFRQEAHACDTVTSQH